MNKRLDAVVTGILLMPFMALIIGGAIAATHGWILLALPAMVPLTFIHDFIWWPSKTHCMTCISRYDRSFS